MQKTNDSSYIKTIIGFIGITIFYAPFFGGAVMLIAAIISSGFFWFLILFAMAWIGGVVVSYTGIFIGFIKELIKIHKERKAQSKFRNRAGIDNQRNRISPHCRSPPILEVPFGGNCENCVGNSTSSRNISANAVRSESQELIQTNSPFLLENHVFCYKCGKILPSDALYCLQCGVPLNYSRLLN